MKWFPPVASLLLAACPPASDDDDASPPPELTGWFTLAGQIVNNDCLPTDGWDLWTDLFPWAIQTPGGQAAFRLLLTQDGTDLSGAIWKGDEDTGCVVTGSVGATGNLVLSGPCDDELIHRALSFTAVATPFGAGFDLDGHLRMDVDGGDLGAPDGAVDCVVPDLSISGTGG